MQTGRQPSPRTSPAGSVWPIFLRSRWRPHDRHSDEETTGRGGVAWPRWSPLFQARTRRICALLTAYQEEGAAGLKQAFDFEQDIPAAVDGMMGHLAQFAPPSGRLLLVIEGNTVLGRGALRPIAPEVAEIKGCTSGPRHGAVVWAGSCS